MMAIGSIRRLRVGIMEAKVARLRATLRNTINDVARAYSLTPLEI
jgi:hypothetical protein